MLLASAPAAQAACNEGDIIYNQAYCVPQYCNGVTWKPMAHPHARDCNGTCGSAVVNACTGVCGGSTPAVGTVCTDGSVYAGLSTDGNVPMYTQRCDIGMSWSGSACTGTRSTKVWSTSTTVVAGYFNVNTGQANTAGLYPLSNTDSPYTAAITCHSLNEDGHTDWYLPSQNELNVLYTNKAAIGSFDVTDGSTSVGGAFPGLYWSSTEYWQSYAWYQRFSDGSQDYSAVIKSNLVSVRCTRR